MSSFSRFNFITTAVYLLHLLSLAAALGNSPTQFYPEDDFAVNCGSSGSSTALDGREWIGDAALKSTSTLRQSVVSSTAAHSLFVDSTPYMTARISRSEFTYRFQVKPGQKFLRLHFYPASYRGFEKSKALFDVRAGPYTLLANFSASLTADALGVQCFLKEYCVNVQEDAQMLSITFSPSQGGTNDDIYAFINGIEIVSMPTALYYSADGDLGAHVAGEKFRFYIDRNTALELVHRLNVGGRSILPLQDLGMFRLWSEDKNYLLESDVLRASTTVVIKYTDNWKYAGPPKLYQTAWAVPSNAQSNQRYNYTWKLPVDLGFRYLVRLHFCDPQPETTETARNKFSIFVNNQIAESEADVMRWSGGRGVAVYRDYVVSMGGKRMEAKRDLIIALQPMYEYSGGQIEAMMMNGIEIFKLSNPDNDLSGPNPASRSRDGTWWTSKLQKLILAWGRANAIVTGAFLILILLNIVIFQLTIWKANDGQMNISSSSSLPTEDVEEQGCRLFSLVEIQLATNNFHEKFVIGKGGFGKVYRGLMDAGTKVVAIKRLNPESKQGAEEFWAEVETLSMFQHTNLVSLLGYYEDRLEMLLVYEYVASGSLADRIYKASGNSMSDSPLSWEQRLNICIGAARGLNYLHTGRGDQDGVIHRDVKSSNILLDENLVAKISDFGLCKMFSARPARTHVTTKVKGTFGFMDPDYFVTHRLTFKSDVYAFGVVLLEVVCGRPALDRRVAEDKHSLALWVRQCITEGTLDLIVDPSLREQISARCLRVFVEIASKCLRNQPNERPSMSDLVGGLEHALELQGRPDAYVEEEAVSILEEPGRVDTIVEETEHISIQAPLEDSHMSGDHIGRSGQRLENFNKNTNEMDISISETKSKGTALPPKRRKIKSSRKWWNSIWRRGKQSKSEYLGELADLGSGMGLCRRFSYSEIQAATNNFEQVLGMGGFGKVYFGQMGNTRVAIKISSVGSRMAAQEFRTEVEMLSRLRHVNLVSLLGYCDDERTLILVYDYMSNGNLQNHLYDRDKDPLPWKRRLQICVGAARGLYYLHTGAEHKIIHRDVKSTNILLDERWAAKIADFAMSKLGPDGMSTTAVTTAVRGTLGYLDPEYIVSGRLTEKSDVYSFGVVLFEVLCARPVISTWLDGERTHLAELVGRCIRNKTLYRTIDPYLMGKIAPVCFKNFVEIAASCLHSSAIRRPSMSDVVEKLQFALVLQESMESDAEVINFDGQFDVYDVDVNLQGGLAWASSWGANTWVSNTSVVSEDSTSRDELLSGPR